MVLAALGTVVYAQNYYPPPDAKPAPKTSNGLVMGYEPDQNLLVRAEGKPAIERDRAYLTNEANPEAIAEVLSGKPAVGMMTIAALLGSGVDDLVVLRSCWAEGLTHDVAIRQMNTETSKSWQLGDVRPGQRE